MTERSTAARAEHRPWLSRIFLVQRQEWHRSEEIAAAVLGTVVGAAAMLAASAHGTLGSVAVSVLVTLLVYGAAERYAALLAIGLRGERLTWTRVRASLRQGWPMVEAAYTPLVVLLVVALLTRELRVSILVALAFSTVELVLLGILAARRAGFAGLALAGWAAGAGAFGVVIIVLKLLLH